MPGAPERVSFRALQLAAPGLALHPLPNAHARAHSDRVLWCNFPEPDDLHDWNYAGKNFRQRLALKRLAARWLARLEGMPARKRGYVLNEIQQHHFQRCGP